MAFVSDPTNTLFPDKIATGTLPAGRDPRTVPQAANFNDLKSAALELRSEVLSRAKVSGGSIQGFWVGVTPPPDATWIWIVTGEAPAQPVSISAVAALLGITAPAPDVQAVGAARAIAAQAVALGFLAPVPTVTALGTVRSIAATAASLAFVATAPAVAALTGGGGATLVPNGGFETTNVAGGEQTDAWWATTGVGGGGANTATAVGRLANAEITGSYVGQLSATGFGGDELDDPAWGICSLLYKRTAADLIAKPTVSVKVRPKSGISANAEGSIFVHVYDGASARVLATTAGKHRIKLWGEKAVHGFTADDETMTTPNVDQTYPLSFNLKTWIEARLDGGKTWADVAKVILEFNVESDSSPTTTLAYIDDLAFG